MKEILESVSNPFSSEKYFVLLRGFLRIPDEARFRAAVVSQFRNRELGGENGFATDYDKRYVRVVSRDDWEVLSCLAESFPAEHRIYINAPMKHIHSIVGDFISECEKRNLPFELKHALIDYGRNDTIVIGSHTSVYKKHIDILRDFAKSHPEILEQCGTPPLLTSALDGWLGLADENISNRYLSYNQSRINLIPKSIVTFLFNHPDIAEAIHADKIVKYSKLASEDNPDMEHIIRELNYVELTPENKSSLAIYMQQHPHIFPELYDCFLDECEKQGLCRENPMFYQGSQEQLLANENLELANIDDETRLLLETGNSTDIFNAYFSEDRRMQLSTESRIEIIKTIIKKECLARELEYLFAGDFRFLATAGLLSEELCQDISKTLYPKETLDLLYDFCKARRDSGLDSFAPRLPLEYTIKKSLNALSQEELKQLIDERRVAFLEHFKASADTPEKKQERIKYFKSLNEQYTKGPNWNKSWAWHLDLLEDDLKMPEGASEIRSKICAELESRTIDSIDMNRVLDAVTPVEPR